MEHSSPSQIGLPSGCLLHKALRRGLASNLRVLTLHNAADNQLLKIIGQYAQHLTNLDITSSWLVDDVGIGDLLLKVSYFFLIYLFFCLKFTFTVRSSCAVSCRYDIVNGNNIFHKHILDSK